MHNPQKKKIDLDSVRDAQGESNLGCCLNPFLEGLDLSPSPCLTIHITEWSEIYSYCKSNVQKHIKKTNQTNPSIKKKINRVAGSKDKKRGLSSLHYQAFLAQHMELGLLSLSVLNPSSAKCSKNQIFILNYTWAEPTFATAGCLWL